MLHLMRRKLLFFILSSLVILPGLFFLLTGGLKFGIDFTGGSLLEYKFEKTITKEELQQYGTVTKTGDNAFIIRTKPQDHNQLNTLKKELSDKYGKFEASREERSEEHTSELQS